MAALFWSAACLEKQSGVLEEEVTTRVTRQSRAEPQVRDHCRSNVTNE